MATAVATAARRAPRISFDALICRSTEALRAALKSNWRLAALDVTKSHISISVSDRSLTQAFPFGILARTAEPHVDAKILTSAFRFGDKYDDDGLQIGGLVVGVSPEANETIDYTKQLLEDQVTDELESATEEEALFPGLKGVLFYSEAHVLQSAIRAQQDFITAIEKIPPRLETRKQKRFAAAMNPRVPPESLVRTASSRARISATEILQAVLDDIHRSTT